MEHHSVFQAFPRYSGPVDKDFQVDFLGAKMRSIFCAGISESPSVVYRDYPPVDEEYFEWIDLLESVVSAGDSYTMLELGAGYGRWSIRAARAIALYRPIPFHLVPVEAEPTHFAWLEQHFKDNDVEPSHHTLIQAALSDKSGEELFYVGMPDGGKDRPDEWYGQALAHTTETVADWRHGSYEGFDLIKFESGTKSIAVKSVTLLDIAAGIDSIDLIDFDVQGAELRVVESAIEMLDQKVTRLHIGTHAHDVEEGLRNILNAHGWRCTADYKCNSQNDTPWGPVYFGDGVQSWINPGRKITARSTR
jgi:FkbM family methyltransferase